MILERGFLTDEGDVGMREDTLDTSTELRHYLGHTLTGLLEGGTMDIGLRGDAADIETGASDVGTLEDDHLQALLGSIFRSTVAARSGTNDNEISFFH
jgi:hypothetical protein